MNTIVKCFKKNIIIISLLISFYNSYGSNFHCSRFLDIKRNYPKINIEYIKGSTNLKFIGGLSPYLIIFDDYGYPLFYRKIEGDIKNFKYHSNGNFTYYNFSTNSFFLLDSILNIIDTIKVINNYNTDFHDIKIDNLGYIYLIGNEYKVIDMSDIVMNGSKNATVIGAIIQVKDKFDNILFNWRSLDYFSITDADEYFVDFTSDVVDYVHPNSIDVDSSGNIYLSSRHLNEITKIDGKTGDVIWRLGGKNNDFELSNNDKFFSGQHSLRYRDDSTILLFDNGNIFHPTFSKGLKYRIYENERKVELINEFKVSPDVYTPLMGGNINQLENGNYIVGWGKNASKLLFSLYDRAGDIILKSDVADGYYSYYLSAMDWKNPWLYADIDSIRFDTVYYGSFKKRSFNVRNNSNKEIKLTDYIVSDTCFYISEPFPMSIPAKSQKEINIYFTPSEIGGTFKSRLYINSYSDTTSEQLWSILINVEGYSVDVVAPKLNITPLNNSSNISLDTNIVIKSNESLRLINDSDILQKDIYDIFVLKKDNELGINVPYIGTINQNKNEIILYPESLKLNSRYCLIINDLLEDSADNKISPITSYFSTVSVSNIDEIEDDRCIIYPNPSSGSFIINVKENNIDKIAIYNEVGNVVAKSFTDYIYINSIEINLCDYKSGIYFVTIWLKNNDIMVRKLVKK